LENGKSLRQGVQDGYTYFGCKKSIKKLSGAKGVHFKGDKTGMGATGASHEEEVLVVSTHQIIMRIRKRSLMILSYPRKTRMRRRNTEGDNSRFTLTLKPCNTKSKISGSVMEHLLSFITLCF
jgi:hypothetical protein